MRAPQLRTVIIQQASLANVQVALDLLRNGQGLTAGESGTVAYDPLGAVEIGPDPVPVFDGIYWNVFLFVSTG